MVQRAAQTHGQLGRTAYRLFGDIHEFVAAVMGAHVPQRSLRTELPTRSATNYALSGLDTGLIQDKCKRRRGCYSSTTLNAWRTIATALGIDCCLPISINTPQSL